MAAPIRKGRALAYQRLGGVVFLVVIALLVELTIALYQKKLSPAVDVRLQTDNVGNQLTNHADVKMRGVLVGEVRKVASDGDHATLTLAIKPSMAKLIPSDVTAQLLPKTLFGEKEVDLDSPGANGSTVPDHLTSRSVILQDRTTTGLETEKALNDLLPLLKALKPQDLSVTLNAVSTALRGRGNEIGKNLAVTAQYFTKLNPSLPTAQLDAQGLADFTNSTTDASPQLLTTLDNLSATGRNLVVEQAQLDTFLKQTSQFSATARSVLAQNSQGLIDLARYSTPSLVQYAKDSPMFPCFLNGLVRDQPMLEQTFTGGLGLHITLSVVKDDGAYVQGDQPQYKETRLTGCYGLNGKPIIPFPDYINPQDGYRDSEPPQEFNPEPAPVTAQSLVSAVVIDPTQTVGTTLELPAGVTSLGALLTTPMA